MPSQSAGESVRRFAGAPEIQRVQACEGAVPAMAPVGRHDPLVPDAAGRCVRALVAAVQRNGRRVTGGIVRRAC
jgi:hypothetical protein